MWATTNKSHVTMTDSGDSSDATIDPYPDANEEDIEDGPDYEDRINALKNYLYPLLTRHGALRNLLRVQKWSKTDIEDLLNVCTENIDDVLHYSVHEASSIDALTTGPNGVRGTSHFASATFILLCLATHLVKRINANNIAEAALHKTGGVARSRLCKQMWECMKRNPIDVATLRLIQGCPPPFM